jgi:hypothetical protein
MFINNNDLSKDADYKLFINRIESAGEEYKSIE